MTDISAKIIADSISPDGHRLTTMELEYPRFILPELNTHRVFSRNTASSRAIPTAKLVERVRTDPAMPVEWGRNQAGMQAEREIRHPWFAREEWELAANEAAHWAERFVSLGVHKQVVNRILEPFLWAKTIVSSTTWDNFFNQRCSPLAQPEMRVLAEAMREALEGSTPELLMYGHWHHPYVDDPWNVTETLYISAARCARVSYLNHDGQRDVAKDLELFERLTRDGHLSPLEHVATPMVKGRTGAERWLNERTCGNFTGWAQLRHMKGMW